MTRKSRPAGVTVSTRRTNAVGTENHGQIPSAAPTRGIRYLSIVFDMLGEPHELRVEIGGERDTDVHHYQEYTTLLEQGYVKRRNYK